MADRFQGRKHADDWKTAPAVAPAPPYLSPESSDRLLDARREVHGLVDEMNKIRKGLLFNADFVLKAGLMLTDIASVGFRVENFTRENMATLEENWPNIHQALLETVELVDSFGFDSRTLQATNSLLPVAYYLYQGHPRTSRSATATSEIGG